MSGRSVSIVIPFFNAAATLRETLISAVGHRDIDVEIIAVDDGSTDDSLAIARGFEPAVTVLTGPNRGVSAARNRGFAASNGAWIVFLDSDDLLLPGTLKRRLEAAAETGADVIVCDWQELIDRGGKTVAGDTRSVDISALQSDGEIACATYLWASTAALLYRRSLVKKIGGFSADLPVIQDARFLFDATFHGARFGRSDHVGALYRILPQSLSRRDPAKFWRDVLTNGKQIEALWSARGPLTPKQREALASIYDHAARGLVAAEHGDYFEAVERERKLGVKLPLHPRIAYPLARSIGLKQTKRVLKLLGR
jgi:glycosyltransferase involved in cell wall biosynthesis